MTNFKIELAETVVEVSSNFPFAKEFCEDYLTDKKADFSVVSDLYEAEAEASTVEGSTVEYAETLCIFRKIAEVLPLYNCAVFHCAAISYKDKAYLFAAPSGTGKSTHIMLWRKHLGQDVGIVNGDKPIIKLTDKGFYIFSTPWAGKENWQRNISLPVGALGLITRSEICSAEKINPTLCVERLIRQIYMPKNPETASVTLDLVDKLCSRINVFEVKCDISETAVSTSFEALTGLDYPVK